MSKCLFENAGIDKDLVSNRSDVVSDIMVIYGF